MSAQEEAWSSVSWAAATDKASVVKLTRGESDSSHTLGWCPAKSYRPFNTAAFYVYSTLLLLYTSMWLQKKIRLTRRFSFILFIKINKINKRMGISKPADGQLSGQQQAVALIWSDGVVGWCSQGWLWIQLLVWPPLALFIYSQLQTLAPENTICGKKIIDWKIDLFL